MRKLYTKEHQSWDTVCESILSNLMYERIGRDVIATLINEMRIYSETKVDVATQEVLSILFNMKRFFRFFSRKPAEENLEEMSEFILHKELMI